MKDNSDVFISRREAIDVAESVWFSTGDANVGKVLDQLKSLPTVYLTLYGYKFEQLAIIAMVLQKEGLPPERVTEALTDINRIISMVRDEYEEALRKALEQIPLTDKKGESE